MRTRKTQNIKINMTCGSDFRLKKLYSFLHIFLTFSRVNSRLGTSPPMMKSVWSHLKHESNFKLLFEGLQIFYFSCWNAYVANKIRPLCLLHIIHLSSTVPGAPHQYFVETAPPPRQEDNKRLYYNINPSLQRPRSIFI
jgi:hypothetical protein